jgi:hypothetical protein
MTPEAQRIAIAEYMGWAMRWQGNDYLCVRHPDKGACGGPSNMSQAVMDAANVPDYLNDLNAMHEAEKVLETDRQLCEYDTHLATIVMRDWKVSGVLLSSMDWHAKAAQRAEAFLKCLDLWRE